MEQELFETELESARRRVAELVKRVEGLRGAGIVGGELLKALRTSLGEVRAAEDSLSGRNERLDLAKHAAGVAIRSYRELFDTAPGGYVITDSSGVIVKASRALSSLLGCEAPALCGKPIVHLVAKTDRRRFLASYSELRRGEKHILTGLEVRLCRRHGKDWLATVNVTTAEGRIDTASAFRWWIQDASRPPGRRSKVVRQRAESRVEKVTAELDVAREDAKSALLELSGVLDRVQEKERSRMAIELHDGMGQNVAALILNLTLLRRQHASSLNASALRELGECLTLAKLCSREARTAAYLLHPPLFELGGLKLALRHFVREFARRSLLHVELDLPARPVQLSSELELALFRTVRECLFNVHRHSGSRRAGISLRVTAATVRLDVRDRGRGFPPRIRRGNLKPTAHLGVGLTGLIERIRELGGDLSLKSDSTGATLSAVIPRNRGRGRS